MAERAAELREHDGGPSTGLILLLAISCGMAVANIYYAQPLIGLIAPSIGLGPAVAGSIGIAPSANINPEKLHPSMFEPVHGSAPDIAGKGICNPIGQIWSGAMMLEHLGEAEAAQAITDAIEKLLAEGGPRTRDMGGQAGTEDLGKALAALVGAA